MGQVVRITRGKDPQAKGHGLLMIPTIHRDFVDRV